MGVLQDSMTYGRLNARIITGCSTEQPPLNQAVRMSAIIFDICITCVNKYIKHAVYVCVYIYKYKNTCTPVH